MEKIREYGDKKSQAGGKMVDATPATEAELQNELDKVCLPHVGGQQSSFLFSGRQGLRRWSWSRHGFFP